MQAYRGSKLLSAVIARAAPRRNYISPGDHKPATFNDLPTPQGCWQTNYDAKQRKYNGHLLLGIAVTIATYFLSEATGCWEMNHNPPAKPGPKINY